MPTTVPRHVASSHHVLQAGLPERRYLPELHGVRGLALLGVVLFHLFGAGRVSGGIDIFLAVSGFLFTGMLLREAATREGRVDPLKYYGRLIRRILVPAAIVVAATLVLGLLISPATKHRQLWTEARASLLYVENFELISSQLAYGAAGPETSPFQHFWSLSVQGQFYIIWPAITIAAVLVARRLRVSAARVMAVMASVILVASLSFAIYMGSHSQQEAYLLTTTRAWQLAFGGLLALAGATVRLPERFRAAAGWVGLGLIVSGGFVLDGAQLFPGPWALWPLAGLTLVLISAGPQGGDRDPRGTATRFLSNRVFAWIGDRAYGLYLWHWPLVIFYLEFRNRDAFGIRGALVILAATVLLATLTYRFVEVPLQQAGRRPAPQATNRGSQRTTVVMGATLLVVGSVALTAFSPAAADLDASYANLDPDLYPGAAEYLLDQPAPIADVFPPIEQADMYRPAYSARGCQQEMGQAPGAGEITVCEDEHRPEAPTATVVLAGGSHAGHLEAAFQALARKYGWELLIVTKSSCVFGLEGLPNQERCGEWNENFVDWLAETSVDLVVTPGSRLPNSGGPENVLELAPAWWQKISDTGTELLLVRGMPRQDTRAPECLAAGGTSQECGPSKAGFAETYPLLEMDLPENAIPLDMTEYVCPQITNAHTENCDSIVGNILVSYDNHHFTTPFSQSLAPAFEAEMRKAVPHLVK